MKPAICPICGKSILDEVVGSKGEWIEFKNYSPETSSDLSHPVGLEYFCSEHLPLAKKLVHQNSDDAINELKIRFPVKNSDAIKAVGKRSWWQCIMGR